MNIQPAPRREAENMNPRRRKILTIIIAQIVNLINLIKPRQKPQSCVHYATNQSAREETKRKTAKPLLKQSYDIIVVRSGIITTQSSRPPIIIAKAMLRRRVKLSRIFRILLNNLKKFSLKIRTKLLFINSKLQNTNLAISVLNLIYKMLAVCIFKQNIKAFQIHALKIQFLC